MVASSTVAVDQAPPRKWMFVGVAETEPEQAVDLRAGGDVGLGDDRGPFLDLDPRVVGEEDESGEVAVGRGCA